ncbi:Hypothetical_protein [Hexamita inflata]|uniref:Hypothetical_protein n=1 Tax=Hexamita inflata TaxID=28002 RepID=A0AA86R2X3_9EUKA|nr:Hypothetical protein HINF_LOCUS48865 [Hexamita inflata]
MGKGGHGHSHGHSHSHSHAGHSHGGHSHAHTAGHHHTTVSHGISHHSTYHPTYHHKTTSYHSSHKTGYSRNAVVYSGGSVRRTEDPLATFENPSCMRKMSWIIFCVMCVGLSFIIAFAVHPESYLVGLVSFGSIILVYSSIFAVVTVKKCCQVGSLRYFMCPCLMSQFEIAQLRSKCQVTHDRIFGTKVEQTDNQVLDVANQNNYDLDQGLSNEGNEIENDVKENDETQNDGEVFKEPESKPVQAELVFSAVM